jgi:hypothetical protein
MVTMGILPYQGKIPMVEPGIETLTTIPRGWSFTSRLNITIYCVPLAQRVYVFCVDLRTNSDYFPIQHELTGFYN